MNLLKLIIVCGMVSLLICDCGRQTRGSDSTFSQERTQYGREWQQLNQSERTTYLAGVRSGVVFHFSALRLAMRSSEGQKELNLNQNQKDKIDILMQNLLKGIDFSSGAGVVADVMRDLYRDPANTFIPWPDMAGVAVMRLQGKPGDDIIRILEGLRRVWEWDWLNKKEGNPP